MFDIDKSWFIHFLSMRRKAIWTHPLGRNYTSFDDEHQIDKNDFLRRKKINSLLKI